MATGDTVVKQKLLPSSGAQGGNQYIVQDVESLDCNIQGQSFTTSLIADTSGEKKLFIVFFSEDPELHTGHQLKVMKRGGVEYSNITLRVLASDHEGRPGKTLLWYANCELLTQRRDR